MKENRNTRYPIGQQDFKILREQDLLYIDKTRYIETLLNEGQYYFLARPRRFGKSLFLSTLRYFFEGRRELFRGLYIDSIDWDWKHYPVLHLDLNPERYAEPEDIDNRLSFLFRKWEEEYGILPEKNDSLSQRFAQIIESAHRKTGLPVVILVDEYNKPLVANLNDGRIDLFRSKLASVYSNFKSSAEHIRFVLLTGVSRFSKLSVFSDLNNIRDITFSDQFADICGITEKELLHYFEEGIRRLALSEEFSFEEARDALQLNYDGYRFSIRGSEIYNPWSLLNAMQESRISDYWARTGKPTIIVRALRDQNVDLEKILSTDCSLDQLQGLDLSNIDPLPLLFQTGYLTIKHYDRETGLCRLGIPNREVARDLFNELLPFYVNPPQASAESVARNILNAILKGEPQDLIENIDIFLAGIPYEMKLENENNFHNAVYILLRLIGARTQTEVHTADGRIDLLVKTNRFIYIIELKFDKDSQTALDQIVEKQYARSYAGDPRTIYQIGVNFNKKTRSLDPPAITKL